MTGTRRWDECSTDPKYAARLRRQWRCRIAAELVAIAIEGAAMLALVVACVVLTASIVGHPIL